MSTSLHAVFNVVFVIVDFVIVIFIICGRKMQFSESSQNSISEKSILVNLRSFFSTYKNFPGREWLFPVIKLKEEYFYERTSSLAGLKKRYSIFRKSTDFGHFSPPRSTFKVDFPNVQAKFRKILAQFPGGGC